MIYLLEKDAEGDVITENPDMIRLTLRSSRYCVEHHGDFQNDALQCYRVYDKHVWNVFLLKDRQSPFFEEWNISRAQKNCQD